MTRLMRSIASALWRGPLVIFPYAGREATRQRSDYPLNAHRDLIPNPSAQGSIPQNFSGSGLGDCTTVVHSGVQLDREGSKMAARRSTEANSERGHKFSVSIPLDLNRQVDELARKHRVSKSWIVREALERLLGDDMPLFHFRKP